MGSPEKVKCWFCKRVCEASEEVGWIIVPDGTSQPVHLTHAGAAEEYERQKKKQAK